MRDAVIIDAVRSPMAKGRAPRDGKPGGALSALHPVELLGQTLKGLMDRTNRRFKVVFAGLHNVQRTTTLSNHPLAHYGTPICVGPLFDAGEWREARALIEGNAINSAEMK